MMNDFGGFQGSLAHDMNLLYCPSFKYQDTEFRKSQEFMDFNSYNCTQQNQQNSGLTRYRSAPSSLLESLVNGDGGIGIVDYRYSRPATPEIDTMLAKFMSPSNVSGNSISNGMQDFGEIPAVKKEIAESAMAYQSLSANNLVTENSSSVENSLDRPFSVMDSMPLENSIQATKMNPVNRSNLVRQNSSPPGLFSSITVDNGFGAMRDAVGFRVCNGTNGEPVPSNRRLNNHTNFSSGPNGLLQISEDADENVNGSSPDSDTDKRQHMTSFTNGGWDETSLSSFKRAKDNDGNVTSNPYQSGHSGNCVNGLTHHLSLPKSTAEMATLEKFLQFRTSVPCKIRAKRGFATHPRSIAERVRRTRISERMRKLQDLFPNMDKQTNTADMLEMAVEYIKDLEKRVKILTDSKAMCTCPSKQRQLSNCLA